MRLIDADELIRNLEGIISDYTSNGIYPEKFGIDDFIDVVKEIPTLPAPQWIRVEDRMPIEYESVFKKFKSTPKWLAGMYETISNDVNAVVKFEDGTKKIYTLHTADGKWSHLPILGKPIVTHWMPLPELPEERYKCRYADDNGVCSKCSGNGEIIYCVEGPCPYDLPEEVKDE